MTKLKMRTQNKADENYKKLAELFPNAVTETIDETTGEVVRAIDKDVLMQEINTHVVDGKEERYQFTWPDKKKSVLLANSPIAETLRPCREESVDFDNTENLYIEGDNLDVLKLLQETYLGKVKMIYIDPPYNTGNDFVYNDDFAENTDDYLDRSGQFDEDGNRLFHNTESNGRFHTDWLNMIYPRLKIARNLLSDDGVIFISIDDNEQANLKEICDEVFGAENFSCLLCVKMSHLSGMKMSHKDKKIPKIKEFVYMYVKNINNIHINPVYVSGEWDNVLERYTGYIENFESDISKWKRVTLKSKLVGLTEKEANEFKIRFADRIFRTAVNDTFAKMPKDNTFRYVESATGLKKISYNAEEVIFAISKLQKIDGVLQPADTIGDIWTDIGINNLHKEGGVAFPNGKKPLKLINRLLKISTDKNSIVMDFFSGSATTAHAVMQLNAEDGGHRKFIMVQLPEKTDEKSEAFKAGYKNICEIGKERIRRAGKKIKAQLMAEGKETRDIAEKKAQGNAVAVSKAYWIDSPEYKSANKQIASDLDTGFRVLKLDSTNMKDVYYNPAEITIDTIMGTVDNIKEDRTPEDLLFQVMLDLGVLLSSKIEKSTIGGKTVFNVEDSYLIACFDDNVTDEVITAIAKQKPYYFVMRDSSMANDSVATNFEQIFAAYSPDTVRKVL